MNKLYPRALFFKRFNIAALLMASVLFSAKRVNAQAEKIIGYTQYADNLTAFNPAYSLLDKAGSVSSLLSRQFVEIQNGAPTAFLFNLNLPFEQMDASGGLIVKNNSIGPETLTEVNAFFAKAIQLTDKDFLSVSLNAGFRKYVDLALDPDDPEFNTDIRQTSPNLGFGVMAYGDDYFLGISVPELTIKSLGNADVTSQVDLKNHYFLTGALLEPLDDDFKFKPSFIIAYASGAPVEADVSGMLYIKDMIGLGVGYRTSKLAEGMITYTFNYFRLGYSYQVGTESNNFGGVNSATQEITLSYRFGKGLLTPKLL
jgi:type IX secretion system PorP/SprF family membrane protein